MGKGKRNKPVQRGYRVPRWHDLTTRNEDLSQPYKETTRIKAVFPRAQSAMLVKPRGGQPIAREAFKELYSSHVKGPENTTDQWIRDSLGITQEEERRLKRNIVLTDGTIQKELWHELKLIDLPYYLLKLCFYGNKAVFVEMYKAIKTIAISQPYSSSTKAMDIYNRLGKRYISWGQHRPYADGTQGAPSP